MVFLFILKECLEEHSQSNLERLRSFLLSNSVKGQTANLLRISDFADGLDGIVDDLNWTIFGSRSSNDIEVVISIIKNNLAYPDYLVLIVSLQELEAIRNSMQLTDPLSKATDLLIVLCENNSTSEQVIQLDMYNPNQTLEENLIGTIRNEIYPQLLNFNGEVTANSTQILKDLSNTIKVNLGKIKILGKKKILGGAKATSVWESLKNVNKDVENIIEKTSLIFSKIEKTKNEAGFSQIDLIKRAWQFNSDYIKVEESQCPQRQYHQFKITNNTDYIWENIQLLVVEQAKAMCKPFGLNPREILEFNIDYEYDLLGEIGNFNIQAKYRSHVISGNCNVARISITGIQDNGRNHLLLMRNHFIKIENCVICWVGNDGIQNHTEAKFASYSENRLEIHELVRGDNVCFQVFSGQICLSSPAYFLVN